MAEVTDDGLIIDRQPDITDRVTESWTASFGDDFDVSADGDALRLTDPVITQFAETQELVQAVIDATDEARALGTLLRSFGRISGFQDDPGARSVGTLQITGDAGTLVREGYQVANNITGVIFETTENATLPDTAAPPGTEVVEVPVQSVDFGAFTAGVGTLTNPINVVGGVVSVTNTVAVTPGAPAFTDPQYRNARRAAQVPTGLGTVGGIFQSVSAVENVQGVNVINNNNDTTDPDGVPPHHIRVVVFPTLTDPDDEEAVALALAANQTPAIQWDGDQVFDVATAGGTTIQVAYAYATPINIVAAINITDKTSAYPSNGDDLVKDQFLKWFGLVEIGEDEDFVRLQTGDDVVALTILCNIRDTVPGIRNAELLLQYKPGVPVAIGVLPISASQIATIEDSATDVTVSS